MNEFIFKFQIVVTQLILRLRSRAMDQTDLKKIDLSISSDKNKCYYLQILNCSKICISVSLAITENHISI